MRRTMPFAILVILALVLTGCPPPPHARRHRQAPRVVVRKPAPPRVTVYRYRYYPNAKVYYCTVRKKWYHRRGGAWVAVTKPPADATLGSPVSVEYEHDHPRYFHNRVIVKHPGKPVKVKVRKPKPLKPPRPPRHP